MAALLNRFRIFLQKQQIYDRFVLRKNSSKTAFSMIELSIVAVVISLLVGLSITANRMSTNAKLANAQSLTKSSPVNDIDGLTLWFETTMPQSIKNTEADDGKTVSTWYDLSTNKFNVSGGTATYKENTIGGLPTLYFGSALTRTNVAIKDLVQNNQATIFTVHTYAAPSAELIYWQYDTLLDTSKWRFSINPYGLTNIIFDFGGDGNCCTGAFRTRWILNSDITKIPHILSFVKSPSNGAIVMDGTTQFTETKIGTFGSAYSASSTLNIGRGASYVGEIIVFNRALSKEERKDVEQYLSKKWGIAVSNM